MYERDWERNTEMQYVYDSKSSDSGTIELRPLWLTVYGFQVLSSLGLGLECSEEEFNQVQYAMQELGFEIEVWEEACEDYPDTISPELREYIWRLAECPELRARMSF